MRLMTVGAATFFNRCMFEFCVGDIQVELRILLLMTFFTQISQGLVQQYLMVRTVGIMTMITPLFHRGMYMLPVKGILNASMTPKAELKTRELGGEKKSKKGNGATGRARVAKRTPKKKAGKVMTFRRDNHFTQGT